MADDPQHQLEARRAMYRRRRIAVFTPLIVFVVAGVYVLSAALAPLPSAAAATSATSTTIVQPAVQPAWPAWGSAAVGAIGYKGLLAQKGNTKSVPIASMTKTITALVVLDAKPIAKGGQGPTITFTDKDVEILNQVLAEDGSWASVTAGQKLTERQALEAMLLPSANNYAISLANWAYGSEEAFLKAANKWLPAHGFTGTRLADASGLNPRSVSTPADLVGIGKLVVSDPVLASIVATKSTNLPEVGTVDNGNKILGTNGINGIKTGWTDQAGHCLLFAQQVMVGGHRLQIVGVVLGAAEYSDLWTSVPKLLTSIAAGFHEVPLTGQGKTFGSYSTAWGATTTLTATKPASMLVWSNTPITVTVNSRPVQLATPGDEVGAVTFTLGKKSVERPLTVTKAVKDPGLGWRLSNPAELFF